MTQWYVVGTCRAIVEGDTLDEAISKLTLNDLDIDWENSEEQEKEENQV